MRNLFCLLFFACLYACTTSSNNLGNTSSLEEVPNSTCDNIENYKMWEGYMTSLYKYDILNCDPFSNIKDSERLQFKTIFESNRNARLALGIDQYLNSFQGSNNYFAQKIVPHFVTMNNIINTETNCSSAIAKFELQLQSNIQNSSISCEEKKISTALYSMHIAFLKYYSTHLNTNSTASRGCSEWELIKCYWKTVLSDGVAGAQVGLTAQNSPIVGAILMITGAVVGAGAGHSHAIINIALGEHGPCCPIEYECNIAREASIKIINCNSADVTPLRFGKDAINLLWRNTNCVPETATTPANNPTLRVTQNSEQLAAKMDISTTCPDGIKSSYPYEQNIIALAKTVNGTWLGGPDKIASGFTYFYPISYTNASSNYSVVWEVENGSILSSSRNGARINWNTNMEKGKIIAKITSSCPGGETNILVLNVSNGGPQP